MHGNEEKHQPVHMNKSLKNELKICKEITLPWQTAIYQSNRIPNGKFKGFTLMQSKGLICLIKTYNQLSGQIWPKQIGNKGSF
jgi:hypothetical protein